MNIPEEALNKVCKRLSTMDYRTRMNIMNIVMLQTAEALNDHLNKNPKMKELIFQKIKEMEVANVNK